MNSRGCTISECAEPTSQFALANKLVLIALSILVQARNTKRGSSRQRTFKGWAVTENGCGSSC
jgi:hypothetical protein